MTTLPNSGATELVAAQANAELAVNAMGRRLDANVSRAIIEDRDLSAAPGTCADGARYLVAATPGGGDAWAGQTGKMAIAVGTNAANGWLFQTVAVEGFRLYIRDENIEIEHSGSAWGTPTLSNGATATDVWAGTSTSKVVTPDALQDAAAPVALTSSASVTPDFNTGLNFSITLAHDGQLENPTNVQAGDSGVIIITQDGTGNQTWTYGGNWKFPGGAPVLSTTPGAIDVLAYYAVSSSVILANLTKAYSS